MDLPILTPKPAPPERAWQFACLAVAAVALGVAIHIRDGLIDPRAVAWLLVTVGFALAGMVRLRITSLLESLAGRWLPKLIGLGIAAQFAMLLAYRLPAAWHD